MCNVVSLLGPQEMCWSEEGYPNAFMKFCMQEKCRKYLTGSGAKINVM